jgi:trehalose 6-phosphate synthase
VDDHRIVPDDRTRPLHDLLGDAGRLIVVSNRGPVTFQLDPSAPQGLTAARGPGGLVTALGELGRHAPVSWVAAAITDGDRRVAPRLGRDGRLNGDDGHRERDRRDGRDGRDGLDARVAELVAALLPGQDIRLRLVDFDPSVFEPYYHVIANPFLWFVQHRMYSPAYGPNVDRGLLAAWRGGYRPANEALADAAVEAAGTDERPVVLLQDYHLYLAPSRIRRRLPGATILHFNHIRVAGAPGAAAPDDLRGPA